MLPDETMPQTADPPTLPAPEAPAEQAAAPAPDETALTPGTVPAGLPPAPSLPAEHPADEAPEEPPAVATAPEPPPVPNNKRWYVVKVQSGREETIKEAIEKRVKIDGLEEYFGQIYIPVEKVTEVRTGRRY